MPAISRTWRVVRRGRAGRFFRLDRDAEARRARDRFELRDVVRRMLRSLLGGRLDSTNRGPAVRYPQIRRAAVADCVILSGVAVDPFADAEVRYKHLVEERRTGNLQARAFRVAVRDLAVLDNEGRRWMLGPEDGVWYRRENERWLQADPPRRLVCPSCGHHNLGRHSFCVECGHRLNRPQ
jgi:hypothetical protein